MATLQLIQLYFYVCEIYEEELQWHCQRFTKNQVMPLFTDQEVLTTYLYSVGFERKFRIKDIHNYIQRHWLSWFPSMPDYTAYVMRLNRMAAVFPRLAESLIHKYEVDGEVPVNLIALTDSMPIITCSGKRKGKVARELCDKGYNSTKKMHFFGLKLHGIGFYRPGELPKIDILQTGPASQHDLEAQRQILENIQGIPLFADKAFCDKSLSKRLKSNGGELLTPVKYKKGQPLQDKQRHKAADDLYSTAVSRIRQPIESLFNWLIEHTDIQRAAKVRSTKGLIVHVFGRIAAVLMSDFVNRAI